jgi:hypothetical protein
MLNFDFFLITGKINYFDSKKIHHFKELDELILKINAVWGSVI